MKIDPGKAVGGITIGMLPEEYEAHLGNSQDAFKRTPESIDLVIAYDSKCMHLLVDEDHRIKLISVFRPEKVELQDIQLLGREMFLVERDLSEANIDFVHVDAGLWCPKFGVLAVEVGGIVDGVEISRVE